LEGWGRERGSKGKREGEEEGQGNFRIKLFLAFIFLAYTSTWYQSYKTFFSSSMTLQQKKLERSSLAGSFFLV
jgi:hypothetical protein